MLGYQGGDILWFTSQSVAVWYTSGEEPQIFISPAHKKEA